MVPNKTSGFDLPRYKLINLVAVTSNASENIIIDKVNDYKTIFFQ